MLLQISTVLVGSVLGHTGLWPNHTEESSAVLTAALAKLGKSIFPLEVQI